MSQPIISIQDLSKRYHDVWAVKGLNLTVEPGEMFALAGPNGAGKTTTIKILMGLTEPTSGKVCVLGLTPRKEAMRLRAQTGYAQQQLALDLYLTAYEHLSIFADLFNIPRAEKAARIEEILEWAGLTDAAHRLVITYSGGMQRRLNLALGLLHRPQLLFLDEPTLGLDVHGRRQLWDLIRDIKASGTTIILTTHYLEEANTLCDRVGIMAEGRLAALGTPQQLRSDVADELFRLTVTFDNPPSLGTLALPVIPEVEGCQAHFVGSHRLLWQILGVLQKEYGQHVREATYLQPTLDDVVIRVTEGAGSEMAHSPSQEPT